VTVTAHPPSVRWHVETYDPTAAEWVPGRSFADCQDAVKARADRDERYPNWSDGTPAERRIVLETTTFVDMGADVHLAKFPKSGFVLSCTDGQDFVAIPGTTPDGRPSIRLGVGSSETGHAEAGIPLEQLEEVIAGLREIARQQASGPAPALPGRPVTAEQLARAREILPEGAVITAAALRAAEPLCGHGECNPTECFVDFA
jgi:hypothetical protein